MSPLLLCGRQTSFPVVQAVLTCLDTRCVLPRVLAERESSGGRLLPNLLDIGSCLVGSPEVVVRMCVFLRVSVDARTHRLQMYDWQLDTGSDLMPHTLSNVSGKPLFQVWR